MNNDNRKVALIGTGMVGMSFAFALTNHNLCNELVLIDLDKEKAEGEAMDLNHGMAFSPARMLIYSGEYADCHDADIVVVTAGSNQKPGETRLQLLERNAAILSDITEQVVRSGFNGIFLVASNPVDLMTMVVKDVSGFESNRVLGSGTTLDTARFRYLVGNEFQVDPRNVHGYVIGEHGDSEFVPWSQAMISTVSADEICRLSDKCQMDRLHELEEEVRNAAYVVIQAKRATYYGIGMALVRIVRAIFADENSVLTVSSYLTGEFGETGLYIGVPSIVGRNGVRRVLPVRLTPEELEKFHYSCSVLRDNYHKLRETAHEKR